LRAAPCRKCDVGGDVITFVRHVDGCTFKEAVNLLTGGHTPPQKPATGARHAAFAGASTIGKPALGPTMIFGLSSGALRPSGVSRVM
jgi:hypothetical protein